MDKMDDGGLDDFFEAARAAPPPVPAGLADRVLQDALAAQASSDGGFGWRDWLSALGGKRGLGGLVTAACVGFWIGVAPPQALPDLAGLMLGQDLGQELGQGSLSVDEDASGLFGWDLTEG